MGPFSQIGERVSNGKKNRQSSVFAPLFRQLKQRPPRDLDSVVHQAHRQAFAKIDCLECAQCCKTTGPLWIDKDVERVAKRLRMKAADFFSTYLRVDEDGDTVLQQVPCAFLAANNECTIYDDRPKACREFPHTDRPKQAQILALTERNAEVCPAVVHIAEKLETVYRRLEPPKR